MIYGYARVSTKGQARDGNSLEAQTSILTEAGAEKIYYDSYTGTTTDRPEFDKLKDILAPRDKLLITKLDRFARTVAQGSSLIESLIEKRRDRSCSQYWYHGQHSYRETHTKHHAQFCRV